MTIIVNAVQDGTDRRKISVTARGLTDGVTVFAMGDGVNVVTTASSGTATASNHIYAADGTYEITVYNGSDAGHLTLLPVKTGVAWPVTDAVARLDPDSVPLGVIVNADDLKSSHVKIDWKDGSALETVQSPPGGTLSVHHRYPYPGVFAIGIESYTEQDTASITAGTVPVAVLTSLVPNTRVIGTAVFTLRVLGSNFTPQSKISFDAVDLTTVYVSATEVTAQVDPAAATAGAKNVLVKNPGVANSNTLTFTYTAP